MYSVESIIDKKIQHGSGNPRYLVKWLGYSWLDCTWEPVSHLNRYCQNLVTEFDAKYGKMKITEHGIPEIDTRAELDGMLEAQKLKYSRHLKRNSGRQQPPKKKILNLKQTNQISHQIKQDLQLKKRLRKHKHIDNKNQETPQDAKADYQESQQLQRENDKVDAKGLSAQNLDRESGSQNQRKKNHQSQSIDEEISVRAAPDASCLQAQNLQKIQISKQQQDDDSDGRRNSQNQMRYWMNKPEINIGEDLIMRIERRQKCQQQSLYPLKHEGSNIRRTIKSKDEGCIISQEQYQQNMITIDIGVQVNIRSAQSREKSQRTVKIIGMRTGKAQFQFCIWDGKMHFWMTRKDLHQKYPEELCVFYEQHLCLQAND